jgi:anion-transporting  ArsA/GET3 family ATPase
MELPRLIFITGKGGTGKSTVAAALASGLARHWPTWLADLDERHSAARLLGVAESDPASSQTQNPEVHALSAQKELEAFIERIVPLRAISRRMLQSRTFGYVTGALPGLEAFLLMERLRNMAGEAARTDGYVVIDGPASGTTIELLSVARSVRQLAPAGLLNRLASQLENFLHNPNLFGVAITLTPEELALREALETAERLSELKIRVMAAVLNGVAKPLFTEKDVIHLDSIAEGQLRLVKRRIGLADAAKRARSEIEGEGISLVELPMLFKESLGKREVVELSHSLEASLTPE